VTLYLRHYPGRNDAELIETYGRLVAQRPRKRTRGLLNEAMADRAGLAWPLC
jgi:hypothetical protein